MNLWFSIPLSILLTLIVKEDFEIRKASNRYIFFVFVLSIVSLTSSDELTTQVILTAAVFLIFFYLWMISVIGAGDVKLITSLTLGIKPELVLLYLVVIGLLGGLQALCIWLNTGSIGERGLPFTLPISLSGFVFYSLTQLTY
ncbi:Type IV prepilin peptidase TadV/CpaA [Vibrio owensii]|uniref:Type IV prepilin peptidase TadV/CpaA n=1 Tax=Vibrio owensii TaxID=696485 RepID=A0AAU9Q809_9VIBR|nr:Type IV prepilin peptidase TadV/CpaA [Vibrio owensii]